MHRAYESFICEIARIIPVIKVDYSRFQSAEAMAAAIRQEYEEIGNVRHVRFPSMDDKTDAKTTDKAAAAPRVPAPLVGEEKKATEDAPAQPLAAAFAAAIQ